MSLLRCKELAKSKSELGDKINYTRDVIAKHNIDQQASQESFAKVFKPVTSKLDDAIESNLQAKVPKKRVKKGMRDELEALDYYPDVDPFEDMDVENMIEPQQQKQIPIPPPSYSEVVDQEGPDYGIFTEDEGDTDEDTEVEDDTDEDTEVEDKQEDEITPEDFDLPSIEDVKTELVDKKNKTIYLKSIIKKATHERNRLNGFKASNTKKLERKKNYC